MDQIYIFHKLNISGTYYCGKKWMEQSHVLHLLQARTLYQNTLAHLSLMEQSTEALWVLYNICH